MQWGPKKELITVAASSIIQQIMLLIGLVNDKITPATVLARKQVCGELHPPKVCCLVS